MSSPAEWILEIMAWPGTERGCTRQAWALLAAQAEFRGGTMIITGPTQIASGLVLETPWAAYRAYQRLVAIGAIVPFEKNVLGRGNERRGRHKVTIVDPGLIPRSQPPGVVDEQQRPLISDAFPPMVRPADPARPIGPARVAFREHETQVESKMLARPAGPGRMLAVPSEDPNNLGALSAGDANNPGGAPPDRPPIRGRGALPAAGAGVSSMEDVPVPAAMEQPPCTHAGGRAPDLVPNKEETSLLSNGTKVSKVPNSAPIERSTRALWRPRVARPSRPKREQAILDAQAARDAEAAPPEAVGELLLAAVGARFDPAAQKRRLIRELQYLLADPGSQWWLFRWAANIMLVYGQDETREDAGLIYAKMAAVIRELRDLREVQARKGQEFTPRGKRFNVAVHRIAAEHKIPKPREEWAARLQAAAKPR